MVWQTKSDEVDRVIKLVCQTTIRTISSESERKCPARTFLIISPCNSGISICLRALGSFDSDDLPASHRPQIGWCKLKDGVWGASGRPDLGVLEQILVDKCFQTFSMADWWYPTNRKACMLAHKIGVGLLNAFACQFAQALLIDSVWATGNYENGFAGLPTLENQRFHDLFYGASNSLGGLFSGAGRVW